MNLLQILFVAAALAFSAVSAQYVLVNLINQHLSWIYSPYYYSTYASCQKHGTSSYSVSFCNADGKYESRSGCSDSQCQNCNYINVENGSQYFDHICLDELTAEGVGWTEGMLIVTTNDNTSLQACGGNKWIYSRIYHSTYCSNKVKKECNNGQLNRSTWSGEECVGAQYSNTIVPQCELGADPADEDDETFFSCSFDALLSGPTSSDGLTTDQTTGGGVDDVSTATIYVAFWGVMIALLVLSYSS
eukprot:TRINITY_DN3497_c0_g1_i1.p1 TRINITY_DN3497_c0_g1~~TRINITY_DN3497_c0_g1_i1.p1  ORF type:complete len:246 (+),score=23.58 TRINITY_DN3497_c0_g1_i1:53-790(+)